MIIRETLPDWVRTKDLTIAHWEIGRGYYYFDKEKFEKEITHVPWIENYNVDDWSPNTSFLCFNNMELLRKYHKWHKHLVNTHGKINVPEWFWLLTDQGILGHIVRENDFKVNTLTQEIALSHHNTIDLSTRYKGKAEKWYSLINPDYDHINDREKEVVFEHVWLDKINTQNLEIKKWFKEIVEQLDGSKYLDSEVWYKHWIDYHENN